ncbi:MULTISPECIES: phage major capsid protein [Streptomyces]|uniref:phage major capsid protein n=1 Tax=Streptomyces TaxID=1883 RepID=UPI0016745D0B|nr:MULTISPECIES: hypothetical protein [Streptomyces]MBK3526012.1 hypothetical protein [Streptomyces sp. MBT70]GGR75404.1 bacteriophage protein [Streptomyces eurythermus]
MSLAYQQPGTTTFIPEIWDAELLTQFDPLLVWASPFVSNNKYEGEIRQKGDVVHINSLLRPTVGDYTIADGMTAQRPETVDQKLTITEAKYLQVLVEDAERVQLAGGLDSPINQQMIRALAREADAFMGNIIAIGATALPAITPTAENIPQSLYSAILDMMLELDSSDIPAGRYVVVSPRVKRYLIEHPSVANAAAYGEGGVTANGVVARLAGFTILTTTAMPAGVDIVAGHSEFATYASQFTGFREGQSEKYRADYIDTLHLYGGKIVRYPELDTKKADNTFDESKPTKGIVKAAVTWPTS